MVQLGQDRAQNTHWGVWLLFDTEGGCLNNHKPYITLLISSHWGAPNGLSTLHAQVGVYVPERKARMSQPSVALQSVIAECLRPNKQDSNTRVLASAPGCALAGE